MTRITVKQAAELLGLDVRAVRDLIKRGEFGKAIKREYNVIYLIYREQIEKWLGLAS